MRPGVWTDPDVTGGRHAQTARVGQEHNVFGADFG